MVFICVCVYVGGCVRVRAHVFGKNEHQPNDGWYSCYKPTVQVLNQIVMVLL